MYYVQPYLARQRQVFTLAGELTTGSAKTARAQPQPQPQRKTRERFPLPLRLRRSLVHLRVVLSSVPFNQVSFGPWPWRPPQPTCALPDSDSDSGPDRLPNLPTTMELLGYEQR